MIHISPNGLVFVLGIYSHFVHNRVKNIIHLMSAHKGNSFVFPRDLMFPKAKSRETLRFEGKQNSLFPEGTDVKDAVKSVLRIGSAHNKGGLADINIAQISYPSNFFDIKL